MAYLHQELTLEGRLQLGLVLLEPPLEGDRPRTAGDLTGVCISSVNIVPSSARRCEPHRYYRQNFGLKQLPPILGALALWKMRVSKGS